MKKLLILIPMAALSLSSCKVCYECKSEDVAGFSISKETCDEDERRDYEADGWDCEVDP